jgi:hypothetical protein
VITWREVPMDARLLYSPVGLLLIDDLTGRPPIGAIDATLELQDGAEWREVPRDPVITASGVLIYPGLGRSVDLTQPPQHYRVRLESAVYRPLYRVTADGIEFDAPPFDDANPPAVATDRPTHTILLPGANYAFAPYLAVLRGRVEDAGGNPVPDVLVQEGLRERTLTDQRGAFSLTLRWVPPGTPTLITADDQRNGRAGSSTITLPAALEQSQTITVT